MGTKKQSQLQLSRKRAKRGEQKPDSKGRVRVGKYRVKYHEDGHATVYGRGVVGGRKTLPSPNHLRERVELEMRNYEHISRTTYDHLRDWGYLNKGDQRRAVDAGIRAIGIGKEKVRTPADFIQLRCLRGAERAVRSCWTAEAVEKFMRDPITYPLPGIQEFRKKNNKEYKYIKSHGGMFPFMEKIRPGLYRKLLNRSNDDAIDLDKLGEELRAAMNSGIPVCSSYFEHTPYAHEKRWFNHVWHAVRHNDNFRDRLMKGKDEKYNPTFNDAVAYLTKTPESEVRAASRGVKACGKLAERFVESYLVWAAVSGHDPLNLDLPPASDIKFGYDQTRFTFNKNRKGWADGRIGDFAIEVKTGMRPVDATYRDELIDKHCDQSKWEDGRNIAGATFFLHQEPRFYREASVELYANGFEIIGFKQFHRAYSSLLDYISTHPDYRQTVELLSPQINTNALKEAHLNLHREERFKMFSKGAFEKHRDWIYDQLKSLAEAGRNYGQS